MAESLRDKSRINWVNDNNSDEQIKLGCMLRIADATEVMAKRYTDIIDECERAKRSAQYWREMNETQELRIRSLKGQITKLKKRLAQASAPKEDSHD